MKSVIRALTIFVALFFASLGHAAVVLTTNSAGKLTGATGIDVSGSFYNVQFTDGRCSDLFSGCDSAADFTFNTESGARNASLALLSQVFNPNFTYDTDPSLTNGCPPSFMGVCWVLTPFKVMPMIGSAELQVSTFLMSNGVNDVTDSVPNLGNNIVMTQFSDTNSGSLYPLPIYAVWTVAGAPSNSVPEPGSIVLLGMGLLGLLPLWRRRQQS